MPLVQEGQCPVDEIHRHGLIELGPISLGTPSFLVKPAGGVFGNEGYGEN